MTGITAFNRPLDATQFLWEGTSYTIDELNDHLQNVTPNDRAKIIQVILINFNECSYRTDDISDVRDELALLLEKYGGENLVKNIQGQQAIKDAAQRAQKKRDREGHTRKLIERSFGSSVLYEFLKQKYPERAASGPSWWRAIGDSIGLVSKHVGATNITVEVVKKAWSDALLFYAMQGKPVDQDLVLNNRHAVWLKKRDVLSLNSTPLSEYNNAGYRIGHDGMIEKTTISSEHADNGNEQDRPTSAAIDGVHQQNVDAPSVQPHTSTDTLDQQQHVPNVLSGDTQQGSTSPLNDGGYTDTPAQDVEKSPADSHNHNDQGEFRTTTTLNIQQASSSQATARPDQQVLTSPSSHGVGPLSSIAPGDGQETTKSAVIPTKRESVGTQPTGVSQGPQASLPEEASTGSSIQSQVGNSQAQSGSVITGQSQSLIPPTSQPLTTDPATVVNTSMIDSTSRPESSVPASPPHPLSDLGQEFPLSCFGWGYRDLTAMSADVPSSFLFGALHPADTFTLLFDNPNDGPHPAVSTAAIQKSTMPQDPTSCLSDLSTSAEQQSGDNAADVMQGLSFENNSSQSELEPTDSEAIKGVVTSPATALAHCKTVGAPAADSAGPHPEITDPELFSKIPAASIIDQTSSQATQSAPSTPNFDADWFDYRKPPLESFEARRLLRQDDEEQDDQRQYFFIPPVSISHRRHEGRTLGFFDVLLETNDDHIDASLSTIPETAAQKLGDSEESSLGLMASDFKNTSNRRKPSPGATGEKGDQSSSNIVGGKGVPTEAAEEPRLFRDSKLTELLPSIMAVDVRALEDIETSTPRKAGLYIHQPAGPFECGIPAGTIVGHSQAVIYADGPYRSGTDLMCSLSGKTVYIFYDQPTACGRVPGPYFGVSRGQKFDDQGVQQLPIDWFPEFADCVTQTGRTEQLRQFGDVCTKIVMCNNNIIRDLVFANVIRARRAQINFCQAEFEAANYKIFRPGFQGAHVIQNVSKWVDSKARSEFPAYGDPVGATWIARGREKFFFTSEQEQYVHASALYGNEEWIEKFLDNTIIPRTGNPRISTFVVYGTWTWLMNMKATTEQFVSPRDREPLHPSGIRIYLKLFACAVVYAAARHSKRTMARFEEQYDDPNSSPESKQLQCKQLADVWMFDAAEIILMLLNQQPFSFKEFEEPIYAINELFSIDHSLGDATSALAQYVAGVGGDRLPAGLLLAPLSCGDDLNELSQAIASAANDHPSQQSGFQPPLAENPDGLNNGTIKQSEVWNVNDKILQKQLEGLKGRDLDDLIVSHLQSRIKQFRNYKEACENEIEHHWRCAGYLPV